MKKEYNFHATKEIPFSLRNTFSNAIQREDVQEKNDKWKLHKITKSVNGTT
jgi:hypothetical protein